MRMLSCSSLWLAEVISAQADAGHVFAGIAQGAIGNSIL